MQARVRDGDLGMMKRANFRVFFARSEALLLIAAGPSDELESQLAYALSNVTPSQLKNAKRFDAWMGLLHGWVTVPSHAASATVVFMMVSNSMGVKRPRRA